MKHVETQTSLESISTWNPIRAVQAFLLRQSSSFTYLNVTQFLGALNDNVYKFLLVYFLIQLEGIENSPRILAITGAVFVAPFLLFSSTSGTLADRLSKRNIIVFTKILEFVIMAAGVLAFIYASKIIALVILFLMATSSAIFGPSKYGIIPELVSSDRLSRANGLLSMFTFLAIICGTFLPSFLLDHTGYNFILASFLCTSIAFAGLLTAFCIEQTPPGGSSKKVNPRIIKDIYDTLKLAKAEPSLLMAVFASAYFMFCAAFFQLNMIPYAVSMLGLTDLQGGYLFCLTALGIGIGSVLAGKISGKEVELALVPLGGLGLTVGCFLLDYYATDVSMVVPMVIMLGVFGGIYVIPLDSYIQFASPKEHRGQVVAAGNFLSFFGVLLACGFLDLITQILGLEPDTGFFIIGFMTLIVCCIIGYQFFDYVTRFVAMVFSRLRFQMTFAGREHIPETPAIYVCSHTAWNDTLVLMGAQRRRMRFFIEQEQQHSRVMRRLYRLMRVVLMPPIETLENNQACLDMLRKTLANGISVCLFVEGESVADELKRLSHSLQDVLVDSQVQLLPVFIDKGEKQKQPKIFVRLWNAFRVPALVTFGPPNRGPELC
ncbi:MAG: MFS transporter [Chlamydiales bacterium]|nr:MFS transporter [Chlamydiales bacterium]